MGAKIIHNRSVEIAKSITSMKFSQALQTPGTLVKEAARNMEKTLVGVTRTTISPASLTSENEPGIATRFSLCFKHNITIDIIINPSGATTQDISFTIPKLLRDQAAAILEAKGRYRV